MHDLTVINTIAAAFAAAWLLGLLTQRLGLSPNVGALLAGLAIGPHTPGFVGDIGITQAVGGSESRHSNLRYTYHPRRVVATVAATLRRKEPGEPPPGPGVEG